MLGWDMKYSKALLLLSLVVSAILFQNATTNTSTYRGGIAGIAPYSNGLMVWGWACKYGQSTPVNVNIYFSKNSSQNKILWKTVPANHRNTATSQQMNQLCGTLNTAHEFKLHIPYNDAVDFDNSVVTADIIDQGTVFSLTKYSSATNLLRLEPELSYTRHGWVRGQIIPRPNASPISAEVVAFKGIPYANPPIHANRWAASAPPAPWSTIKTTTSFGSPCMQEDEHYALLNTKVPRSEDCLYLNVWKPIRKKNRPVIVYIHGGQFKGGWSGLSDYDGAYLASQDIVFVSFNYRVGMMGFFTHPLFDKMGRGNINYGLTDQELALKWVKNNIAEFGGDPNNVTLAGSSAGGASVGYWMANQEGTGLFHKGIIESGGGSLTKWLDNREITKQRGTHLSDELLRDNSISKTFSNCSQQYNRHVPIDEYRRQEINDICLFEILLTTSVDKLKKTSLFNRYKQPDGSRFDPVRKRTGFEFHPVLDHKYVVGGTLDIFKCHQQKDLPLIVGSMGWEGNLIEKALEQSSNPASVFDGIPESRIRPAYTFPKAGHTNLLAEYFYGDKTFGVPSELIARFHSQKNRNTYLYFFNYIGDNMTDTKGSTHQLLTPFVFRSLETTPIAEHLKPSPVDRAVASVWSGYWQGFIKMDPTATNISSSQSKNTIVSQTEHSPSPWFEYDQEARNRLFVNHSGNLLEPGKREFGGRQTYNFDLQGPMKSRYQLIESYYFPSRHFSKCK